jgi:hypothetical protein
MKIRATLFSSVNRILYTHEEQYRVERETRINRIMFIHQVQKHHLASVFEAYKRNH